MRRDDEKGHPMNERLNIAARAHASTDPHAVWALLEDVNRYKDWGPWSESGYVEQPVGCATFDPTLRGRLMRGLLQRIDDEVVNLPVVAAEAPAGADRS